VGHTDAGEEFERFIVAPHQKVLAVVHRIACGVMQKRASPSTQVAVLFKQGDGNACVCQADCGGESGEPSSHDGSRFHA
jgi:hypothetical protein